MCGSRSHCHIYHCHQPAEWSRRGPKQSPTNLQQVNGLGNMMKDIADEFGIHEVYGYHLAMGYLILPFSLISPMSDLGSGDRELQDVF